MLHSFIKTSNPPNFSKYLETDQNKRLWTEEVTAFFFLSLTQQSFSKLLETDQSKFVRIKWKGVCFLLSVQWAENKRLHHTFQIPQNFDPLGGDKVCYRIETSTRTRVDVRRVPGTAGLPGYLVFITMDVSYAAK